MEGVLDVRVHQSAVSLRALGILNQDGVLGLAMLIVPGEIVLFVARRLVLCVLLIIKIVRYLLLGEVVDQELGGLVGRGPDQRVHHIFHRQRAIWRGDRIALTG